MSSIDQRKQDHIDVCLSDSVEKNPSSFDEYQLEHVALPELDFNSIDTSVDFLGKKLSAPILISSMTGGVGSAQKINEHLARAAENKGVAFSVGSQRALLEDESRLDSFNARSFISSVPLIANLGAVNLNYGIDINSVKRAVELIEADALFFHLNPLQEAAQEGGDTNFEGLIEKIGAIVDQLDVPVLVKEVGNGISYNVALQLKEVGVEWIDVSGKGGTSWVNVEAERAETSKYKRLGDVFGSWGIPTADAIMQCSQVDNLNLIAGGGVRSGLDIAKAIALGAEMATMARPFLKAATHSNEAVEEIIEQFSFEFRVALFCAGVQRPNELSKKHIQHVKNNS